ncbi:C4-dicarboxylate TRAP transporter substrate-binding protein [Antarctobacter sp.]|uniref:C4-dicarboxylate TRAP transporter substrate-binding protein n=1 Tax=Antarctobacter sp. TaxID=1872577 RepID=UPI003A95DA6A
MFKTMTALPLMAALAVSVASGATAETYRFSMWSSDNEGTVIANRQFAEDLAEATDGEITFDFFSGGSIMPPKAHLQGVADGVAHAGQVTSGYTPNEVPLTNSLSGFGFIEPNPTAIGAAFADWVMNDPAALKEWTDKNLVPLGGFSTSTYPLICNTSEPITEVDQLKGLKVRAYGQIGTLVQDLGGVPVSIPSSEAYQALQTGALDCAALPVSFLTIDNKLVEISKFTTMTEWSPAYTSPQLTLNKDFWQGLTDEQRATILELSARTHARAQIYYNEAAERSIREAQELGHQVVEPGESLKKGLQDWIDAGVGNMAGVATNTYGVQDPEALFASFMPYVEKWGALVRGMENPNDEDALTKLFLDNMYNNIDPATFAMD